jgi:aspartate dehydrogenase
MIRIGIIGCGTIGSAVALAIQKKFSRFAVLAYLSDLKPDQVTKLKKRLKLSKAQFVPTSTLISRSDFIIETASVEAASKTIPRALQEHKTILVLSVGGILRVKNLKALLAKSRGFVYIPSGAVSGVDAVLSAKSDHLRSVRITTRKPVQSLKHSPYFIQRRFDPKKIRKPKVIFKGNALEAVKHFPENVNVAATLSLAGVGPRKTRVRIIASPHDRFNTHEVEVEGGFGRMTSRITNRPSKENPKTSRMAIASTIATLEKIFTQVKIGT